MSIQKLNIQVPERTSLSQFLTSKPCPPIPIPIHILNQMNRPIEQQSIPQPQPNNQRLPNQNYPNTNSQVQRNAYVPVPYYTHTHLIPTNIPSQIPTSSLPINQHPQPQMLVNLPNQRQHQNYFQPITPHRSQSPIQIDSKPQSHYKINQSPQHSSSNTKVRPKSPKIQFKYVSPPKQHRQLSEIKQVSDSSVFPQRGLQASQSLNLKDNRFTEYKKLIIKDSVSPDASEELDKLQGQIVNSSLKSAPLDKSSLTNYIYMVENKKDSQKIVEPHLGSQVQMAQQQNQKTSEQANKTQQNKTHVSEKESQNKSSDSEIKLKLKNHDEEINEMLKQYEHLKYYQDNDNSSNRLPRVSKNSSDDEGSYIPSGIRSGGNSSIKNEGRPSATFGVILDQQSEAQDSHIRIKQDRKKKRQSINNMIRQDSVYVIEGIEKVKSQVLDVDSMSNETFEKQVKKSKLDLSQRYYKWQQNQIEKPNAQINYKLRQKDLQIKNLKNQVWLMKLRENQLLSTIKKLQSVTKDQQALINKLSKSKQK